MLDIKDIVKKAKHEVFGQDEALERLVTTLALMDRRCEIASVDSGSAPRLNSVLLVGPTASGKTHMVRSIERASGLKTFYVDVSSLTRTGWRGMSIGDALIDVDRWQKAHPHENCVVFWDEFDKVSGKSSEKSEYRSGGALPNMLALFDGSDSFDGTASEDRVRVHVDLRRVCHILGGAFSGIDKIVEKRIGARATGFVAPSDDVGLGSGVMAPDLVSFGIPVEIAGRICSVIDIPRLDRASLARVLRDDESGVLARYGRLLGGGSVVEASDAATELIIDKVEAMDIGARAIEQIISPLVASVLYRASFYDAVCVKIDVDGREFVTSVEGRPYQDVALVHKNKDATNDMGWFSGVGYRIVPETGYPQLSGPHLAELSSACNYVLRLLLDRDPDPNSVLVNVVCVADSACGGSGDANEPRLSGAANVASIMMCATSVNADVIIACLVTLATGMFTDFSMLVRFIAKQVPVARVPLFTHYAAYLAAGGVDDQARSGACAICRFLTRLAKHDDAAYAALLEMKPYNMRFLSFVIGFDEILSTKVCPVVKVRPSEFKAAWRAYDEGYLFLRLRPSRVLHPEVVFESGLTFLRLSESFIGHEALIPMTQDNLDVLGRLGGNFAEGAFSVVMVMPGRARFFATREVDIVTLVSRIDYVSAMRFMQIALVGHFDPTALDE